MHPRVAFEDRLARKDYLLLIVRLLVDENNRVLGGEVMDVDGTLAVALRGTHDILPAISVCLESGATSKDGLPGVKVLERRPMQLTGEE